MNDERSSQSLEHAKLSEWQALGVEIFAGPGSLRGRVLTSAQLRARSMGEVQTPETINRRTQKPERGGLFCARIFGPIEDHSCICTKYRGEQHLGVRCEKCGVEVLPSRVRHERFGHIELAAPVVHPLFRAAVARLLRISPAELEAHLSGQAAPDADPEKIGGITVRDALAALDASLMYADPELAPLATYLSPAQLMLEVVPVLPAGLRPLPEGKGKRLPPGLNDLYRRVVNRNNRLRRLVELDAPLIILHNEYRMLQECVDQLFMNGEASAPLRHGGERVECLGDRALRRLAELAERSGVSLGPDPLATLLSGGDEGLPPTRAQSTDDVGEEDDDLDF